MNANIIRIVLDMSNNQGKRTHSVDLDESEGEHDVLVIEDEENNSNSNENRDNQSNFSPGNDSMETIERITAGCSVFRLPTYPRTAVPRINKHINFDEVLLSLNKNAETRSALNLTTSSLLEDRDRPNNKRSRERLGSSNDNLEYIDFGNTNFSIPLRMKFKKIRKTEIICNCRHQHCVLCIKEPPQRDYGNKYWDCSCASCVVV